jgi:hypothetical protein
VADNDLSDESFKRDIFDAMFQSVAADLVRFGEVDLTKMTDHELRGRVYFELREWIASEGPLLLTIDHQGGLLAEARRFGESNKAAYAIVFYATWIEHWFNSMFGWKAAVLGIDVAGSERLMRQPMVDKAGVSWRLCFNSEFPVDLRKSILRISERRNAFVHYKWRYEDADSDARAEEENLLLVAESIIVELDELENRLMYGGLRARTHNRDSAEEPTGTG